MNMVNGLARHRITVPHESIAVFCDTFSSRQVSGREDDLSHQRGIGVGEIVQRGNMLAWNDQDMSGRVGSGISKGVDVLVL